MPWWSFGSSAEKPPAPSSEFDAFVPPPPAGSPFVPPPAPPSTGTVAPSAPFTGFTPPPSIQTTSTAPSPASQNLPKGLSSYLPFSSPTEETKIYADEDYSKYTSPYKETPGVEDNRYMQMQNSRGLLDTYITNPRARNCVENIKMGMKMGALVGGIFGGLTGTYAAVVHRNLLILPLSVVGGGISFGFFLGCGMMVRCDDSVPKARHTFTCELQPFTTTGVFRPIDGGRKR
eukprot:GHVS01037942.1.p1 GENE.GHVS01037942.1~~GHVS01037942.1.p1  ORF type:complete len:232 (-),score=31.21 GHVS01037942.1:109-804(-)